MSGLQPAGPELRRRPAAIALPNRPGVQLTGPLCVQEQGFNLHAATRAGALDEAGREALLKYVLRPPVPSERIQAGPDGLVRIALKRPFSSASARLIPPFTYNPILILMWAGQLWTPKGRLIITGVLGVLVLLGATRPRPAPSDRAPSDLAAAAAPRAPDSPARAVPERTAAPRRVDPAPEPITESCLELSTKFGTISKLSDLQKDELWPKYDGKSFEWKLQITDVSSGMLSGYTVQAKCSPKSPSLIQDIVISYGSDAKQFVLGLEKDATYTLKGTLTHSSTLMG